MASCREGHLSIESRRNDDPGVRRQAVEELRIDPGKSRGWPLSTVIGPTLGARCWP